MNTYSNRIFKAILAAGLIVLTASVLAQETSFYTINNQDIELPDLIEEVATITNRSFVVDSRVRGTVSVISTQELDADGVFMLLEAILRVHGFQVIDDGEISRVVPHASAKAWNYEDDKETISGDTFVAQVIGLKHITSAEASRVLRQIVSAYGHLAPVTDPNALIVADHAGNVTRILDLIQDLDRINAVSSLIVPMKHAWVRDVASMLEEIHPEMMRSSASPIGLIAFANENNNTIFLRGTPEELAIASETISHLDQPYQITSTTRVFYLQHADAESISEVLGNLLDIEGSATSPTNQNQQSSSINMNFSVQFDASNNAVLARGTPSFLSDISGIIAQLDRPKLQVLIESAIVEVTVSDDDVVGVELGAADDSDDRIPLVTTSVSGILSSLLNSLGQTQESGSDGIVSPGAATLSQISSPSLAVAKLDPTGVSFGAIINALVTSSRADLLSTPYVYALDNNESMIFVGQELPFRTGTFGVQREQGQQPLTQVQREDVGVKLTVTPNIREDLSVRMEVANEVGALVSPNLGIGESGLSDIVTSKREVTTTVVAENGQTIVLGGLMRDDLNQSSQRVPVLGQIPLLGRLFRSNRTIKSKSHLLIFLRPTVISSADEIAEVSSSKLRGIWQLRLDSQNQRKDLESPTPEEIFEGGF
ncbi:MAG: type II secretion system secretin GspD [Gammaproteobacteria bacterium]|nr:type II secretion system secretin GspD [Gammaproteobacteria bacterium]